MPAMKKPRRKTAAKGAPKRKWFRGMGSLHGWTASSAAATRHGCLKKAIRSSGWTTTQRRLLALHNVTKDKGTKRATEADMAWMRKQKPGKRK